MAFGNRMVLHKLRGPVRYKGLTAFTLLAAAIFPLGILMAAGGPSEISETFGWAFLMFLWITSPLLVLALTFRLTNDQKLMSISVVILAEFLIARVTLSARFLLKISGEDEGLLFFVLPLPEMIAPIAALGLVFVINWARTI